MGRRAVVAERFELGAQNTAKALKVVPGTWNRIPHEELFCDVLIHSQALHRSFIIASSFPPDIFCDFFTSEHISVPPLTEAVNSPLPSARMNERTPNVRHRSRRMRALPWDSFEGRGYVNKNREALSTTTKEYSLPDSDVLGIVSKSTSKTSHGSRYLAGSIAIRWIRVRFIRRHPHDKTYSLASLHIPGKWKRSRIGENVLPTPGCRCWQCTNGSTSATKNGWNGYD